MAITNAQQARQLYQFGGGADLGASASGMGSGSTGGFGGGDGDNRDRGRERSMLDARARADYKADLGDFGDPDPEVDVPTRDRKDTGTSAFKNLLAGAKSRPGLFALGLINPVFGIPSLLSTMRKTNQMRSALGLPSTQPLSETDGSGDEGTAMSPFFRPLTAQAPSITEPEPEQTMDLNRIERWP